MRLPAGVDETADEETQHGHPQPRLRDVDARFVVLAEATVAAEPTEGSLDHPATRKHFEGPRQGGHREVELAPGAVLAVLLPLDDLGVEAQLLPKVSDASSGVACVEPELLDRRKLALGLLEERQRAIAILHVGWMHGRAEQQPVDVDDDVALAPLYFFAPIKTPGPPFSVDLTDWLSTMPALGSSVRPSRFRHIRRSSSCICSNRPAAAQRRKVT